MPRRRASALPPTAALATLASARRAVSRPSARPVVRGRVPGRPRTAGGRRHRRAHGQRIARSAGSTLGRGRDRRQSVPTRRRDGRAAAFEAPATVFGDANQRDSPLAGAPDACDADGRCRRRAARAAGRTSVASRAARMPGLGLAASCQPRRRRHREVRAAHRSVAGGRLRSCARGTAPVHPRRDIVAGRELHGTSTRRGSARRVTVWTRLEGALDRPDRCARLTWTRAGPEDGVAGRRCRGVDARRCCRSTPW